MTQRQVSLFQFATSDKSKRRRIAPEVEFSDSGDEDNDNDIFNGLVVYFDHKSMKKKRRKVLRHLVRKHGATTIVHINDTVTHIFIETGPFNEKLKKYSRWTRYPTDCYLLRVEWIRDSLNVNHCLDTTAYELPIKKIALRYHSKDSNYVLDDYAELTDSGYTNLYKRIADFETTTENGFDSSGSSFDDGIYDNETSCDDDWLMMTPPVDCCSYHSLTDLMLSVLKRKFEPKKPVCITIESDEDSEIDEESSEYEEDKKNGEDEVNKSYKDKEHGQHSRDKEDSQSDEEDDENESNEEDASKSETNERNVISDQEDDDENDTGREDDTENIVKGDNKGGDIIKEVDGGSYVDEEDKENGTGNQENSIDKKEDNIKTKGRNNIEKDQAISNKKENEEKNIIKDKEKSNSDKVEAIIIVKKDETRNVEKKDFANSIENDEKNIIEKSDQIDFEVNNGNNNIICIKTGNESYRDKSNNNPDDCTSENENSTVSYESKNNIADKPFATSSPLVVRLSKIRVKTLTDIHIPDKCSIVVKLNNKDLTSSFHEPEATSTSAKQMGEFTVEKPIIGKLSDPQINFSPPVQTKIMPISSLKHLSHPMKLDESTVHQLEISNKFEIDGSVDENMEISCDASYKKENEIKSFFKEQCATNSKNQVESFAHEPSTSKYMTASKELMDTNHSIVTSEKISDEGFSLNHLKPLLNEVVDIVCKHVGMDFEFENEPRNVNFDSNISSVIFNEKKINQSSLLTVINKDVLHIGSDNFDEPKTVNICAAVSTCKSSSIPSSRKTDSNVKFFSQNTDSAVETGILFQNIKCNEMQKVDSTVESHISDIKSIIDPKYVVTNLEDLDKNDCAVVNKSLDLLQGASELEGNLDKNLFKSILTEIIEKVTQTELYSVDNTFSQIKLPVDSTVKMYQNDKVNDNTFLTSKNYISQGSESECENASTTLELNFDSNTFSNFTTNENEIMLDPFPIQLFLSKEMLDPTSENALFTTDEFVLPEIVKNKTNIRKRHLSNEEVHCSNLDTKINYTTVEQTISDSKRSKVSDPETLSVSDPGSSSFISPIQISLPCPYYELSSSKNEMILPVSAIDRNCKDFLNWMRRCPNQKLITPFQKLLGSFKATKTKWRVATYEKAIIALADLDKPIESLDDCFNIHGIGKRIAQKIWRIVEYGSLDEVKYICSKRWVETMKLFRKSWGITPKLAKKLYVDGICTVTDVRKYPYLPASVQVGFRYYDDLRLKMSKEEAGCIMSAVLNEIFKLFPKVECHGCSSLRRNKPSCGHVCILVSLPKFTPNDHKVLPEIVAQLHEKGYIADDLLRQVENGVQTKYVGVFKLSPLSKHRRLCITVCTREEFPCALMYLTGPAYFNKAIQQRAFKKEMVLDEHSLRIRVLNIGGNTHSNIKLHIEDEATIFKYLDLPYRTPEQRDGCLPN